MCMISTAILQLKKRVEDLLKGKIHRITIGKILRVELNCKQSLLRIVCMKGEFHITQNKNIERCTNSY